MDTTKRFVTQPVWSSVLLGPGALGEASLFTYPCGQAIPRLGGVPTDLMPAATRLHTNLNKAGEMGSGIGDMLVDCIEFEMIDGSLRDLQQIVSNVRFTLYVGRREVNSSFLGAFPQRQDPPLSIGRCDTVSGKINVERELSLTRPVLLKMILASRIAYDSL